VINTALTATEKRSMLEAMLLSGLNFTPSLWQSSESLFLMTSIMDMPDSSKNNNSKM
jgi:hypothetical protein